MGLEILNNIMVFVVVSSGLTIAFWSYLGNRNNIVNRLFFVFVNIIVLNILFSYLFKTSTDLDLALFWVRLIWVTASLLVPSFYFLSVYLPQKFNSFKLFDVFFASAGFVLAFLSMFTDLFVKDVILETWGLHIVTGDYINLYYLVLILAVIVGFSIIILKYLRSPQKEKNKIIYLLYGIAIFVTANIIFGVVFPALLNDSRYISFGDYSAIFFIGFTAYAIVKNHLFDVRFAIIRSFTYALVLVTLACLYLIIAFPLSTILHNQPTSFWETVGGVGISLILAFAFQPVKRFFDKVTDKIFYKNHYKTSDFYERLNDALTLDTDLRGILERVANEITNTIKCEQAFFFVHTDDEHFVSAGTKHCKKLSPDDFAKITEFCDKDYRAIATSTLDKNSHIRWLLLSLGVEITLPLTQSGKIIGYLCLGEHLASGYTSRDIRALNMVADELVIAISNALSVKKILELNSTLQQRVLDATKELRTSNMRLRKLDKAKDEFVSVAAHELRTPMTVIHGFINLLEREQLGKINSKQQEVLSKMGLSAKYLIDLVNNMLDLSKLEANKLTIKPSDNSLDDMVSRSLEKISLLYESKGIELRYTGQNVQVFTDKDKFERILVNLLSNAYKFTDSGGTVTISNSIDQEKRMVTMCVADTGIGIPPDSIGSLFRKFSQVDNYLQQTSSGTGLGLSICKQMVDKMGGKIWVESEVGKGSQFYFTMPMSKIQ